MHKLIAFIAPVVFACSSTGTGAQGDALRTSYAGHLEHVFCDVKRPLHGDDIPQDEPGLTEADFDSVLDGFDHLGCNGVRVYIDPDKRWYADYPDTYKRFVERARGRGFRIYANPLGTGKFGKSNGDYVDWIVDYADKVRPHYLGPFNEPAIPQADLVDIAHHIDDRLAYARPQIVGPDEMKLGWSIDHAKPNLLASLDVVGSHDVYDDEATRAKWDDLASLAGGRPTWATECPRDWSEESGDGAEIGIKAIVDANVAGLVIYEAFPRRVDAAGHLKDKAAEAIAEHLK